MNTQELKILSQIQDEYDAWIAAIRNKRRRMKTDLQKYYVEATKKDKVSVHSIYTTMQTLMSVYYTDKPVVTFEWRTSSAQSYADNINRLVEFDYEEMELDKVDYQWLWDSFFHWVGIKLISGWDKTTSTPIEKVMSPLSWVPDPLGWFSIESHRWAWFEAQATKAELRALWYNNVDLINNGTYNKQEEIRQAYQEGRDISDIVGETSENDKYNIYHHYTRINGKPFLITTANENTLIIRKIEIPAVMSEEKKDPTKISFPIALKYFSPLKGDPFGVSIPDLLRDKQTADSKLINLTLITAIRNAFGDDKIYNPKKIKNIRDLQKPSIDGKWIAADVNPNEPLSNVITTVPKDNPTSLPFNIEEKLTYLNHLSSGIDVNQMWISGGGNMTATQAQQLQKNANLRYVLWAKIWLWWEKTAWRLWYRAYIYNMWPKDKKVFNITNVFGSSYFELTKDDFITEADLRIKIVPTSEIETKREKYKNDLYATAPQILADPTVPKVGKLLLKRKMLDFGLLSDEEINKITLDIDEENAKAEVELINAWYEASEPKDWEDHLTYLSVLYWADDNEQKWKAIKAREEAWRASEMKKAQEMGQMNEAMNWADNTMNNIMASNASSRTKASINQEANKVESNKQ